MSGLRIMALGPYQFEAIGFGFDNRRRKQDTGWASIPIAGGMDAAQWTGGSARTETIRGAVFSEFGGEVALEGVKRAAAQGLPLPLVDLSASLSNIFGMQVIERISEDYTAFAPDGSPLKNAYSINLRSYEGDIGIFDRISILGALL